MRHKRADTFNVAIGAHTHTLAHTPTHTHTKGHASLSITEVFGSAGRVGKHNINDCN